MRAECVGLREKEKRKDAQARVIPWFSAAVRRGVALIKFGGMEMLSFFLS